MHEVIELCFAFNELSEVELYGMLPSNIRIALGFRLLYRVGRKKRSEL